MSPLGELTVSEFDGAPQIDAEGAQSWLIRSANFVVRLTRAKAGARIERADNPDEYFVLTPEAGATFETGGETHTADAGTLVIVPPGPSAIIADGDGVIVSVFSAQARDLAEAAPNAGAYFGDVGAAPSILADAGGRLSPAHLSAGGI